MATKVVKIFGNGEQFAIETIDDKGKASGIEKYDADKPLDAKALGSALGQHVRKAGTARLMFLSLLSDIFDNPTLDEYKGGADLSTGKTSKEFRNSVRNAEEKFLSMLVDKGHLKLEKTAGEKGDDEFTKSEKAKQSLYSSLRDDKNYSNAKSWVSKYFAIVGSAPKTKAGFLVPIPVMMAEIQRVLDANKPPEVEPTIAMRLQGIADDLKKTTISVEDAHAAANVAKILYSELEGIMTHYRELIATAETGAAKNIPALADEAIAKMQASTGDVVKQKDKAKKADVQDKVQEQTPTV